jgi:ribonucleotide monophosphatase NagD (HAD superfamily)
VERAGRETAFRDTASTSAEVSRLAALVVGGQGAAPQHLTTRCRRVAIVGDNLAADIAGGNRAGLTTILVLTGTSGRDDVASAEVTPDIVLPDLAALIDTRP